MDIPAVLLFVGLIAILLELFIGIDTGFDLVLIGITLILGGIIGIFFHRQDAAIITTSFFSFLYIFLGRTMIRHRLFTKHTKTNIENIVGKIAIVEKKINKTRAGQVKVGTETWRAVSDTIIKRGERVKVVRIQGVTLSVVQYDNHLKRKEE